MGLELTDKLCLCSAPPPLTAPTVLLGSQEWAGWAPQAANGFPIRSVRLPPLSPLLCSPSRSLAPNINMGQMSFLLCYHWDDGHASWEPWQLWDFTHQVIFDLSGQECLFLLTASLDGVLLQGQYVSPGAELPVSRAFLPLQ